MSELLKINVNDHVEKKNGLSYLSWAWAWTKVIEIDPTATWEAFEFNGFPAAFNPDGSAMVKTAVTIKGHTKTCWLPVMNHRNQAIKNPDSFQVNTAIVRCLTKTISMHGLGLYIYAGEDLPEEEQKAPPKLKIAALDGIGDDLPDEAKEAIKDLAAEATELVANNDAAGALEVIRNFGLEGDERIYLDRQLPSNVRSALRKVSQQQKAA